MNCIVAVINGCVLFSTVMCITAFVVCPSQHGEKVKSFYYNVINAIDLITSKVLLN